MALPKNTPVRIRIVRPSDHKQIKALVKRCLYGAGSPARVAFADVFLRPSAYLLYVVLSLTMFVAVTGDAFHIPYVALIASSILVYLAVLFNGKVTCYKRWAYAGLTTDLTPVGLLDAYGLVPCQENIGDYVSVGPPSFFVAEVDVPGETSPRIVGAIGFVSPVRLRTRMEIKGNHGEMRRLVVSPDYRCLGIAQKLINACEERAKEFGIESIVLGTTQYHPCARRLYERNGYVLFEELEVRSGMLMSLKVIHLQKMLKEKSRDPSTHNEKKQPEQ